MRAIQLLILLMFGVKSLPAQIPVDGLSLWLRADTCVSVSGKNNVLKWGDRSSNGFDAITRTTSYPKLIPNRLNGYPSIRFDGVNNGMETPAFVTFPAKRGAIFIIAKINGKSITSGVGVGNLLSTFHGKGMVWQFCASPLKFSYFDGNGSEGLPISSSVTTDWNMLTLIRSEDTIMKLYCGGRAESSFLINNNQPGLNTLKIGYNGRLGGTALDSIPEILNGEIAEIIIYNRVLNVTELSAIHSYLSLKYNLALSPPPIWERWWFYVLVILLLASVVVMVILFVKHNLLKKQVAALEHQRQLDMERQRISREMHDDIGAGLTQITLMCESAKARSDASEQKELHDIAETSRKLVGSMSEIIWSLNPENKTLDELTSYLREQLNKQLEYSEINYTLDLPEEGKNVILTNKQRRNILLITREIVNNALKHSNATNIWIHFSVNKNVLCFTVKDDGEGFNINSPKTGNGLKNIRHRIEEIGGTLEISTEINKGSIFQYTIPV